MEYIIGIILLLSFFGLAYYCIKGHNLMIGFTVKHRYGTDLHSHDRRRPCYRYRRYRTSYLNVPWRTKGNCNVLLHGLCCSRYLPEPC